MKLDKIDMAVLGIVFVAFVMSQAGKDGPAPTPSPITVDGTKIILLYDALRRDELTPDQIDVVDDLTSASPLKKWIDEKIGKYNLRAYDNEINTENGDEWVKQAKDFYDTEGNEKVPWLGIFTPDDHYSGDVPAGSDATKALIERYLD